MTNQTPHTPTPGFQIKPPVITEELQRLVEENKKLIKTALPAMEENERRKRELELQKQNQLPDYTEIAGLKVLNQDLDKPQCPEVKLLKEKQPHQECCCWELEYEGKTYYQYDFHGYLKEAEFRGLKTISDEDWIKLEKELGADGLRKLLNLKEQKDYKGYCDGGTCIFRGVSALYWSSSVYTPSPTTSWRRYMGFSNASVTRSYNTQTFGFSVRCIKD